MLFYCWPSVVDAGPTIKQHWFNASCFLEMLQTRYWANVSNISPVTRQRLRYPNWRIVDKRCRMAVSDGCSVLADEGEVHGSLLLAGDHEWATP